MPRRMDMCNELAYTFDAICGYQALLRKNILELGVVLVCKFQIVRRFDEDLFFLRFSDTAATGARHVRKEFILVTRQINFKSPIEPMLNTEPPKIARSQIPIHHLEMNTS